MKGNSGHECTADRPGLGLLTVCCHGGSTPAIKDPCCIQSLVCKSLQLPIDPLPLPQAAVPVQRRCVQNADILMTNVFVSDSARLPGVNSFQDTNKVRAVRRFVNAELTPSQWQRDVQLKTGRTTSIHLSCLSQSSDCSAVSSCLPVRCSPSAASWSLGSRSVSRWAPMTWPSASAPSYILLLVKNAAFSCSMISLYILEQSEHRATMFRRCGTRPRCHAASA